MMKTNLRGSSLLNIVVMSHEINVNSENELFS